MSPNRLAHETSPYLRQHAGNPVDWYPWSDDAFARARREDRPVLLSIGYAACHWCHVMAHESFENPATAALMNAGFVNIKVDREERPDVDGIYMQAVQSMTGHGGWPMTVFLTPAGEPFFAGTYFPPEARHGLPAFPTVLGAVSDAWASKRDRIGETVAAIRDLYASHAAAPAASGTLDAAMLARAAAGSAARFDARHGGFDGGGAPRFPQAMTMDFLLRCWRRRGTAAWLEMVRASFRALARGGIRDQVGGGFHRYTVDAEWRVPHFEKMLYDNALLARLGVHLWRATGDDEVRRVTEETLVWLAREMTAPDGGWYSSLDADSEGEEGRFYVWTGREVDELLGADAAVAHDWFGISAAGNFEGANVLYVPDPEGTVARAGGSATDVARAVERARRTLFRARASRARPGRDEKIVAAWNGLMLRAVAEAARSFGAARDAALGESTDLRALALANGASLLRVLVRDDGRVLRTAFAGEARIAGFLEDHAAVALGFLSLYELTFDAAWLARARAIATAMVDAFWDEDARTFFDTARDAEPLITRPRDVTDNATPSGTSLAVELLLHLADLGGSDDWRGKATWVLETLAEPMARYAGAFGHLSGAADQAVFGAVEVALAGTPGAADFEALARVAATTYAPSMVLAGGDPAAVPEGARALLADRPMREGRATAYVCRRHTCEAPVTDPEALRAQLETAGRAEP